jgi:hypothetical protein
LNWPAQNCRVEADESGAFLGRNFAETDAMSSEEIREAYTCLDDLGEFLLQAEYNPGFSPEDRLRAREFSWQVFHMIARRTIRAQADLSPEKYFRAREEILARDGGKEAHLRDLAPSANPWPEPFARFLAAVNFRNGFQTMKVLAIPNRLKWMKICAALWGGAQGGLSQIWFAADEEKEGERLNDLLETIPAKTIDGFIAGAECAKEPETAPPDVALKLSGFVFDFSAEGSTLTVKKLRAAKRFSNRGFLPCAEMTPSFIRITLFFIRQNDLAGSSPTLPSPSGAATDQSRPQEDLFSRSFCETAVNLSSASLALSRASIRL